MHGPKRDPKGGARGRREDLPIPLQHPFTLNHDPVLNPLLMALATEPLAGPQMQAFDLMVGSAAEAFKPPPRAQRSPGLLALNTQRKAEGFQAWARAWLISAILS